MQATICAVKCQMLYYLLLLTSFNAAYGAIDLSLKCPGMGPPMKFCSAEAVSTLGALSAAHCVLWIEAHKLLRPECESVLVDNNGKIHHIFRAESHPNFKFVVPFYDIAWIEVKEIFDSYASVYSERGNHIGDLVTDYSSDRGESGSGLFDRHGKLIGILSRCYKRKSIYTNVNLMHQF